MALLGALGHLASIGQLAEIGQDHLHQREQTRWAHRNYEVDAIALKIELLGAARDDIRGTYVTNVHRLDALLLVDALLLPFALNIVQLSDSFEIKPGNQCEHCIQTHNSGFTFVWVYLVAFALVLPFWSIALLLRCKLKMDRWLEQTLDNLQELRREIILKIPANQTPTGSPRAGFQIDSATNTGGHELVVARLGNFIIEHQTAFADRWDRECDASLRLAKYLLIGAAYVATGLTGYMFWIFLFNRFIDEKVHLHFLIMMILGLVLPLVWMSRFHFRHKQGPLASGVPSGMPYPSEQSMQPVPFILSEGVVSAEQSK
eukprot:TRINITY_DN55679_c0_g1_i1.p1 TRINITY_DN55679_c0_g1~~TRINITY_DN55679_c0_g1_i1.p1  ORF type:complete len:317 (-),score=33.65 TRINITY_DN55679_c0_g1_i1:113-1063(-)